MANAKYWPRHQPKTDTTYMKKVLLLAALGLCLVAGIARSNESATEQLIVELESLNQLQGRFELTQFAADQDQPSAVSSGHFKLLKPMYFLWDIDSPDNQLIVADGEHLWHHDRDLETVTRRSVAGHDQLSPLQVLAGDRAILSERFEVSRTGEGRFLLVPIEGSPGFRSLTLVFANGQISAMEVNDQLNQQLFIQLRDVDSDTALMPADFGFVPPEEADLFYHDQ